MDPAEYSSDSIAKRIRSVVGIATEDEMAAILQVSHETLATWRSKKRGPPSLKLGKKVFYLVTDFSAWVGEELLRQREGLHPGKSKSRTLRKPTATAPQLQLFAHGDEQAESHVNY